MPKREQQHATFQIIRHASWFPCWLINRTRKNSPKSNFGERRRALTFDDLALFLSATRDFVGEPSRLGTRLIASITSPPPWRLKAREPSSFIGRTA